MRSRTTTTLAALGLAVPSLGAVVTSEFLSVPVAEGWPLFGRNGELTTWVDTGAYFQNFENSCEPGPVCGTEAFSRPIEEFNGTAAWFYEYRASATANAAEISAGAPTVLATGNFFGNNYHVTLASDQIKLSGGPGVPILFLDGAPGVPHTIRLELFNEAPPGTFHWYVDGDLVLEGPANSPFPDFDARITWQGRSWMQPTLNAWYYIRFGDIPEDASGDFDSELDVDLRDYFYFHECLTNTGPGIFGGPNETAGPGCRWADFDDDGDVDLLDFGRFQALFALSE